ncbi:uncharacterized protein LOC143275383 [Babylonia areolata]|uniref:uncharacterized protein LOC143275383 n=1 Tax=Babylonia areolata TaxID=304850 RepID=UPI003FD10307
MSTRVIKRTRDPLETLERMLQKTTLTTQRVSHTNIIDLGDKLLSLTKSDDREDRQKAIDDAVEAAEARATRELRAALKRLRQEKDDERERAMDKQKWYFERLAQRVSEQRDRAEEERMKELTKKLHKEKEEALAAQWMECQRLQQEAIEAACNALRKQLRNEFAVEKEQAIAEALKAAREGFKRREQEVIARTRQECQEEARWEAERVARLHQAEVDRLTHKYNVLQQKYNKELAHKERLESDFRALQEDYKRFMDYTDGKFHSDYLMRLRHLGLRLADKRISTVTYEDIEELPSFSA